MKIKFFNDTDRNISIHPASDNFCTYNKDLIKPLEICTFESYDDGIPLFKIWDYEEYGLQLYFTTQGDKFNE